MDKVFVENEALTKIVQMLSDEDDFSIISDKVMKLAGECLECDHSAIMQISKNQDSISVIAEWGHKACAITNDLGLDASIFEDDIVVVNDDFSYNENKAAMDIISAKRIIVSPLSINGDIAMYMLFINREAKDFVSSDITFACNVATILQAVVQKRVINNSLMSSYQVLQDVLNSVGCGIVVYDSKTGDVLFENKPIRDNNSMLKLIDECTRKYFVMRLNGTCDVCTSMEMYEKEYCKWYEIKFCNIPFHTSP